MTDLYVDLSALQILAERLAAVQDSLARAREEFHDAGEGLGSQMVADRLIDFCAGWKDGRRSIDREVTDLIDALRGVHDAYEETEVAIAGSYRTSVRTELIHPGAGRGWN